MSDTSESKPVTIEYLKSIGLLNDDGSPAILPADHPLNHWWQPDPPETA